MNVNLDLVKSEVLDDLVDNHKDFENYWKEHLVENERFVYQWVAQAMLNDYLQYIQISQD